MKLASLKGPARDGTLCAVSRDLARAVKVDGIVPTMQQALESWEKVEPKLRDAFESLQGGHERHAFDFQEALAGGRVVEATELLGAPWFVSGEVIHGEKRGRELGFPTANLKLDPSCGLKHGIYAVRVDIAGVLHDGVASFGRRPMFDDGAPLLEVHLFDFDDDLYGQTIDVAFIGWIRQEQKFESIEALKRHMTADAAQARDVLKRAGKAFPRLGDI